MSFILAQRILCTVVSTHASRFYQKINFGAPASIVSSYPARVFLRKDPVFAGSAHIITGGW